ncbi:phosphatase PAP2 family protein [Sunxiuqinia sp. A32]|uniref:phosphatase PAP2 family protein n=1 Tax=Sunxiuqinia sp. A32 TaxID=3461496 RepID=UPI00404685C3
MSLFESIAQLDQSLFFFFNSKHTPFWDVAMSLFTRTEVWLLFYISLIWFIIKKYRAKAVFILLLLVLTILIGDQLSVLIKETVQRFRPSQNPEIQDLVHIVLKRGGLYGFFSSHATNTFAVAMFTSRLFRNYRFSILIFGWALLASYTRIYLGLHYPGDIIMGIIVGSLIGYAFSVLLSYLENRYYLHRKPRLGETSLENAESYSLIISFLFVVIMVLLVVNRLLHIHLL